MPPDKERENKRGPTRGSLKLKKKKDQKTMAFRKAMEDGHLEREVLTLVRATHNPRKKGTERESLCCTRVN